MQLLVAVQVVFFPGRFSRGRLDHEDRLQAADKATNVLQETLVLVVDDRDVGQDAINRKLIFLRVENSCAAIVSLLAFQRSLI